MKFESGNDEKRGCELIRLPRVLELVPVSPSTLGRMVEAGTFPSPISLSKRIVVWRLRDVLDWIESQ